MVQLITPTKIISLRSKNNNMLNKKFSFELVAQK